MSSRLRRGQVERIIKAAGGVPHSSQEADHKRMIAQMMTPDPLIAAMTNVDITPRNELYARRHMVLNACCAKHHAIQASAMTLAIQEQFPDVEDAAVRLPEYDTGLTACFQIRRDIEKKLDVNRLWSQWAHIAENWCAPIPFS